MIIFKQLRYFWTVATEGGVARACEGPNLAPQTISAQLCLLEGYLGTCAF